MTRSTKQLIRRLSLVGSIVAAGAIGLAQSQQYFFADGEEVATETEEALEPQVTLSGIPAGDETVSSGEQVADGSSDPQQPVPADWSSDAGATEPTANAHNPVRNRGGVVPAGAEQPSEDWGQGPPPLRSEDAVATNVDGDEATAPPTQEELAPTQDPHMDEPPSAALDQDPAADARELTTAQDPAVTEDTEDGQHATSVPEASPPELTNDTRGSSVSSPPNREQAWGNEGMFDTPSTATTGNADPSGASRPSSSTPLTATGIASQSQPLSATGKPGPRELEGPQAPALTVEKSGPAEVQVGRPATFLVRVRNVGQVPAHQVVVHDEVPQGTRLVSSKPPATTGDGALIWQLGTIKPGEEVTASVELVPETEGQIGSVANVTFQAAATARATVTRPRLELQMTAPSRVLIGESAVFSIRLSNPGTGVAEHVILEEDVPAGLRHAAGRQLEYEVGRLNPGESRQLELTLTADQAGMIENILTARAEGGLVAEQRAQLEITAPKLDLEVSGPTRRFLERSATYSISVANPGTATAKGVAMVAHLPRGLKFVNTNNAGVYDAATHTVQWSLEELPAGEMGTVQLTALPIEMGEHKLRVEGQAQMGLSDATEKPVMVEGIAALEFGVTDLQDPVEIDGQTTYEIRVRNQGSKTATNVQVTALVPDGMRPLNGDGATRGVLAEQQVTFEPLAELRPQADATFRVQVQATESGDKRFRAQVVSDEVTKPVITEESTVVYADE